MAVCAADTGWQEWTSNLEDQKDEVLALTSILEDHFIVLFSPEKDEGQFSLQINIPIHLEEKSVPVRAWMPYSDEAEQLTQQTAEVPQNLRPQFQRSESGLRWHSSFHLSFLPPLCLRVVLPHGYPSDSPPVFTLSSLWLTADKLSSLCAQLDLLWSDGTGSPILYTWADWLENNTVSHLNMKDGIVLYPHVDEESHHDKRAIPECVSLQDDLISLIRYDLREEFLHFCQTPQTCGICFDEKMGEEFFRLADCRHHFCAACLGSYCDLHVKEGTVQQLRCPDPECKFALPPHIIQDVIGEQAFARWEKLMLQRALDSMADVEWCPRCNFVVIRETEETLRLAHCTNCLYSFCTNCLESWHQGSACKSAEERMAELEEGSKEDDGSTDHDHRYKRWMIKMNYLSTSMIKKTTKPCPKCRAPIEKNQGCNKVTCICGASMCWLCQKRITDYTHFANTNCAMFPGQNAIINPIPRWERPENPDAERVREALHNPAAVIVPCPRCRQPNLKDGRNNHIRCWSCRSNMCCSCKQLIQGVVSSHYRAGMPCDQHL